MPQDNRGNNPERDPNFFVNFRRYADDRIGSVFDSFQDPVKQSPQHDAAWRREQEDMFRRFERSYERATNPERRQLDRAEQPQSATAKTQKAAKETPGMRLGSPAKPGRVYDLMEIEVEPPRGVLSRVLGFFGKTSLEEESLRLAGQKWKDIYRSAVDDSMRRRKASPQDTKTSDIPTALKSLEAYGKDAYGNGKADADKGLAKDIHDQKSRYESRQKLERAREIDERISRCPWVKEQDEAEEVRALENQRKINPYGCSWSWGPWSWQVGSQQDDTMASAREPSANESRIEEHTFGPWVFGPFHVGPMSMSASFPQDMEAELNKAWEEMERRRKELIGHLKESKRRITDGQQDTTDAVDSQQYSPVDLMRRPAFNGHRNWRQAYEDLLAAERGDVMLGGTPWSSGENESDDSWRARMADRALYDEADAWHRQMLGLDKSGASEGHRHQGGSAGTQASQDSPHTELEFYDSFPASEKRGEQMMQPSSQAMDSPLSTLTTVESVTNPDGSTTTKRSLKRRFADGREEHEDSTESTPASVLPSEPLRKPFDADKTARDNGLVEQYKNRKDSRGHWFWG